MKQCNAFQVILGSASPAVLQKPVRCNKGRKVTRIRARASIVATTTDASAYNMTSANCVSLMAAIFANTFLAWGDTNPEVVDANTPFAQMRYLYAIMEGEDFRIGVAGVGGKPAAMYQLNAVTSTNVQIAASGTSATTTLICEFVRSFTLSRTGPQLHKFCPGYTQMSQLNLSFQASGTSPTFDGGDVTFGNATVTIIFEDIPTKQDPWAAVPKLRVTTAQGTDVPLPIGAGGGIIHVADLSEPATSSVLTLFNIFGDGGSAAPITGIASAAQALAEFQEDLPLGAFDASTLGTPLYTTPCETSLSALDTAEQLTFNQPNDDITSPQLVVIFCEKWTPSRVDAVGENASATKQGPVSVGTLAATTGNALPEHVASVSPLNILSPSSPAAALAPVTTYTPGLAPKLTLPASTLQAASATAASMPGGATGTLGTAYLANATSKLTAATPGASSSNATASAPSAANTRSAAAILTHGVTNVNELTKANAAAGAVANRLLQQR